MWKDQLLIVAAWCGIKCLVRRLFRSGADPNHVSRCGCTPLSAAASRGCVKTIKILVNECDADVRQRDGAGRLPLSAAASRGHVKTIKILVNECKANVRQLDGAGRIPLCVAASRGHVETAVTLIGLDEDIDQETIESLIDLGVTLDQRIKGALVAAAIEQDSINLLNILINFVGVDLNMHIQGGITPLTLAASLGSEYMVLVLVSKGVRPSQRDLYEDSPIVVAAGNGFWSVIRWLLVAGVDLYEEDGDGWNALTAAVKGQRGDVVNFLLVNGKMDANKQDGGGRLAIVEATRYKGYEMVELLLNKGKADPDICDGSGRLAIVEATRYNDCQMVVSLINGGASPFIYDRSKQTAFKVAKELNAKEIIDFIRLFHGGNSDGVSEVVDDIRVEDMPSDSGISGTDTDTDTDTDEGPSKDELPGQVPMTEHYTEQNTPEVRSTFSSTELTKHMEYNVVSWMPNVRDWVFLDLYGMTYQEYVDLMIELDLLPKIPETYEERLSERQVDTSCGLEDSFIVDEATLNESYVEPRVDSLVIDGDVSFGCVLMGEIWDSAVSAVS